MYEKPTVCTKRSKIPAHRDNSVARIPFFSLDVKFLNN
jgi:hypothetical protein